ncbi:hypothetical protein [Actinacidiphila glaucinigra]|uniref:hypothetical protein n=1 Tax=Actinacidiphila glaucinigra TaxID=235986 RepID=UPI003D89B911
MRDWAGGAPLAGGLGALSSVQDLNIGLAAEAGITAARGGLGGLVRRLRFGNYGHCSST